jgi:hypothetical protein
MDKRFVKYGNYYYLKNNNGTVDARNAYIRDKDGKIKLYNNSDNPYQLEDIVVTPKPKEESRFKQALKMATAYQIGKILDSPEAKAVGYVLDPSRHIGAGMQYVYDKIYPNNNSGLNWRDWYKNPYDHPGVVPGSGANTGLTFLTSSLPITIGYNNLNKSAKFINSTVNKYKIFENKVAKKIQPKLIELYLKRKSPLYVSNNQLQLGSNNQKLLGWATQEVMDKYKDPKAVASLYRRARAFANSRAFYKMPTKDMSASELSALARELVERDNTVVRGVSLNRKSIIETAINIDDPKIKGRLIKILNETRGKPFTKESISKEDYEFLADYVLTRVPLLKKPGAGRIDQYSNIKADPMFDSMYSTNSIHEALGYTYLEDKDGIKIIGKIDLTPSELKLESDPFILLDKGNLRKRINRDTKINYNIIKNADRSEGIGRVSITKGNRQIDDNYSIIREQEGKKTGQDHMRLRALRTGIDLLFTPKSFSYLDKSGEKVIKHIRPENKKTFEITSKGIKETEESQEFIKLIRQYLRSKNNRVKTNLLKKVNKKLENHKFIQYKYRTETMIEPIIVDAENGYMDIIEKTKKVKKPVIINDDLLVALQQEISDPNIARHYLINGRRGSKVAELKEILDWDKLKNKFKKSKRNHENKINKSEGLTTAGVTGLGYYINKNNENNKK